MSTKLILPAKTSELDKIQVGWLNFGHLKVTTFDTLEKDELAIQQILLDITSNEDLENVQEKLKQAKGLAEESKGRRMNFTTLLQDRVIKPAMEFEKRTLELITKASAHELALRSAAEEKNQAATLIENEKVALRVHIENEHFRIAAKYKEELAVMVLDSYKNALKNKTPVKEIKSYCKAIEGFLKDVKLDKFVKYERKHLSVEDATAIMKGVKAFEKDESLKAAIKSITKTFTMYAEDLKNRTKAMKKAEEDIEEVHEIATEEVVIQSSINTLTSQSVPLEMSGAPKTKKKLEPIEENTADWALDVIMEYIKHAQRAKQHVRVGSWSKFSVGQMAAALAKVKMDHPEINFYKLKFKEVKK